MRHIITGGLGFTGRYLADALQRRGKPIILFDCGEPAAVPAGARLVRGDIRDPAALARIGLAKGDVVYHLAARQFHAQVPWRNRDQWFSEVNVDGTRNVLDAMQKAGARDLVFFSTDMVYGLPQQSPLPTSHPRQPLGPYGRSKLAAENLLAARASDGFRITVFRPRMIMGAGRLGILAKLFRLIEAGLPVPLIGNGANRYQMVSVHDCVRAALQAVDHGLPTGPFNLGSVGPPTVRELLGQRITKVGSRSRLVGTPAAAMKVALSALDGIGLTLLHPEQFTIADCDYLLDLSQTTATLGFTPQYSDRDMLVAAFEEYLRGRARADLAAPTLRSVPAKQKR
jgi:dTDP-glucose 4,6-dehydratase